MKTHIENFPSISTETKVVYGEGKNGKNWYGVVTIYYNDEGKEITRKLSFFNTNNTNEKTMNLLTNSNTIEKYVKK